MTTFPFSWHYHPRAGLAPCVHCGHANVDLDDDPDVCLGCGERQDCDECGERLDDTGTCPTPEVHG